MKKTSCIQSVSEGKTDIFVFKNKESKKGPGSKDKLPFYNPSMEQNRDISIIICQWLINNYEPVDICDGLAASGIRGVRFAKELTGGFNVTINDWNSDAYDLINKNIEKSNLKNVEPKNINLNTLLSQKKFDYIDIDPFGSPAYFIDSAIRSIKNYGIIACTATDTAALCGTYPKVCFRRYGAVPFHSVSMKEIGLRILLGFICRSAGTYDKGIKPLLSYATDHYFRVYVQINRGTSISNQSMKDFSIIKSGELIGAEISNKDIGPIWKGKLNNKKVIDEFITVLFEKKLNTKNKSWNLLNMLSEEADAPAYFYTTDSLASIYKRSPPKLETLFENIKDKNYDIFKTHYSPTGFKTNAPIKEIEKMFKL